jgi:adenylate cyclase
MVISRASTLPFRGREPDPREVGRALGVRYVLAGSVRHSGGRLRITTQLCDAETGASLWGDRMASATDELFGMQDEIVGRVVGGIAPQVRTAELQRALRKRPESFTAYDCLLRALDQIHSLERDSFLRARGFLDQAMAEDSGFAMPFAWAARWHSLLIGQGWSSDPHADAERTAALATRAIELDRQNALALAIYGHHRSYLFHDWSGALVHLNRALVAGPSNALAWALSSCTLSYIGRSTNALQHAEHALRLSPYDPGLCFYYTTMALAHYAAGRYEQAADWAIMSDGERPGYTANLRYMIASLAALDRLDEARAAAARLMAIEPGFRLDAFERTRQPFREAETAKGYVAHLRKAGLPE